MPHSVCLGRVLLFQVAIGAARREGTLIFLMVAVVGVGNAGRSLDAKMDARIVENIEIRTFNLYMRVPYQQLRSPAASPLSLAAAASQRPLVSTVSLPATPATLVVDTRQPISTGLCYFISRLRGPLPMRQGSRGHQPSCTAVVELPWCRRSHFS